MAESQASTFLDERLFDVSSHFLHTCDNAQMQRLGPLQFSADHESLTH